MRDLVWNAHGSFFDAWRAAIGMQQDTYANRLSRHRFALFQPRTVDGEGLAPRNALHFQRNMFDRRNFVGVHEQPRENSLHPQRDG